MNDGLIEVLANGKPFMRLTDASIVKSNLTYMLATGGFGGHGSLTVSARPMPSLSKPGETL